MGENIALKNLLAKAESELKVTDLSVSESMHNGLKISFSMELRDGTNATYTYRAKKYERETVCVPFGKKS